MISKQEYNSLAEIVESKSVFIDGDNIYFMGDHKDFGEVLCKLKIKKTTRYILNKNTNLITDNKEIYNEYLERKNDGVRGYKTIKIGIIQDYCYLSKLEYAIKGGDIDGFYWWVDRENEISINQEIKTKINQHVNNIQGKFIAA